MNEYLKLLGYRVQDKVTHFSGTITHIGFDLYGCVQAIVHPGVGPDGKMIDSAWFDLKRLEPLSDGPVMTVPSFSSIPGGDEKPLMISNPVR